MVSQKDSIQLSVMFLKSLWLFGKGVPAFWLLLKAAAMVWMPALCTLVSWEIKQLRAMLSTNVEASRLMKRQTCIQAAVA